MQTEIWRHHWKPSKVQLFAHKAVIHAAVVVGLSLERIELLVWYHHISLNFFFLFEVFCSEGLYVRETPSSTHL